MKKVAMAMVICASLVLLLTQTAWAAPPQSHKIVHVVQCGENLYRIARRYSTTVKAIVHANYIANPNCIYVGQRLIIPCGAPCIQGHGYVSPMPCHQPGCGCVYIVRRGDTLSGIAYRHRVSVNSLVHANGIANPNCIYAGQRLVIPCRALHHPQQKKPYQPHHGAYYVVRCGDTLSGIAWRHGVSVWAIAQANHIANPNCIYAGQRLYIP